MQVSVELLRDLPVGTSVSVSPLSADDWEILVSSQPPALDSEAYADHPLTSAGNQRGVRRDEPALPSASRAARDGRLLLGRHHDCQVHDRYSPSPCSLPMLTQLHANPSLQPQTKPPPPAPPASSSPRPPSSSSRPSRATRPARQGPRTSRRPARTGRPRQTRPGRRSSSSWSGF